jgi:hypothetical protein
MKHFILFAPVIALCSVLPLASTIFVPWIYFVYKEIFYGPEKVLEKYSTKSESNLTAKNCSFYYLVGFLVNMSLCGKRKLHTGNLNWRLAEQGHKISKGDTR